MEQEAKSSVDREQTRRDAQPHEWVQGGTSLFGAAFLYFKVCASCGVKVAVEKGDYERLPRG